MTEVAVSIMTEKQKLAIACMEAGYLMGLEPEDIWDKIRRSRLVNNSNFSATVRMVDCNKVNKMGRVLGVIHPAHT
jgi:hypothetical protein